MSSKTNNDYTVRIKRVNAHRRSLSRRLNTNDFQLKTIRSRSPREMTPFVYLIGASSIFIRLSHCHTRAGGYLISFSGFAIAALRFASCPAFAGM